VSSNTGQFRKRLWVQSVVFLNRVGSIFCTANKSAWQPRWIDLWCPGFLPLTLSTTQYKNWEMPCSVAEDSSLGMLCHWASGSSSSPKGLLYPQDGGCMILQNIQYCWHRTTSAGAVLYINGNEWCAEYTVHTAFCADSRDLLHTKVPNIIKWVSLLPILESWVHISDQRPATVIEVVMVLFSPSG